MKTTQRTSYSRARLALIGGAVLLLAALAFLAARRSAEPPAESAPSAESGGYSSEGGTVDDPKVRGANAQAEGSALAEEAHLHELGFTPESPMSSDWMNKKRRALEKLRELTGSSSVPLAGGPRIPQEVIDILVEGMDDLTAAKHLLNGGPFPFYPDWFWRPEPEYAVEYADRVLAKDPTSRDALLVKLYGRSESYESHLAVCRRIMALYPDDPDMMVHATNGMVRDHPEEVVAALERLLPEEGPHSDAVLHGNLGISYERLDMPDIAAMHYLLGAGLDESHFGKMALDPPKEFRNPHGPHVRNLLLYHTLMFEGERNYPSIWEERGPDAAAMQTPSAPSAPSHDHPHAAAPDEPHGAPPPPPDHPDAPRPEGSPPPPNLEAEMSAAYADFAKAYQGAFETEYALSEATPEGYMNALLGMARAFARAGDAKRGQDAYNAVRKRHSREEVQQAFRQMDERERLRRQASNEENDGEDDHEEE